MSETIGMKLTRIREVVDKYKGTVEELDDSFDYTFGGNYDDCYYGGYEDGQTCLANIISKILED